MQFGEMSVGLVCTVQDLHDHPHFLARGAAALGANCQPGFNAVYLFLYEVLDLNVEKLGFIIVPMKNDSNALWKTHSEIFRKHTHTRPPEWQAANGVEKRSPCSQG